MAVSGDGARGAQEAGEPEASQGFTFADLFAGVGGIRRGFESVGGRCVFTSEWNPHAQKTYRANFDDAHEIAGDITKVKAADIPDHDVLVGGFPCFAKGTLVHAIEGLRPIEEIRAGDWVLGCSGEYRRVSAAMMKDGAPTRKLELEGGPGLTTTDEHPFWARSASGEPSWVEAKDLDESMWVGLPIDREMAPEQHRGRGEAFWRLAGLWLRSGAVEGVAERGPRATLGWAKRAALTTRRLLNRSKALRRPVQGYRAELRGMVEEFWSPLEGKRLPGYVHHLPGRLQRALWEGWMLGEGEASKALKLGMERAKRNALGQGSDFVWARVSSNKPTGVCETVHNIAVDEDESYVVEGALVHNCQPFSIAGVSKKASMGRAHGFEDKTQGTLFFDVARIIKAKRPKAFLLENVKNLLSHDKGRTFEVIRETLEEELGYHVQWRVVDSSPWVPQRRERLLIVGFRRDAGFDFKDLAPPAAGPKLGAILHPQDGSEAACPFTEGPLGTPLSKYTVTDGLWAYLQAYAAKHKAAGNGFGFGMVDEKSVARTLSARYYKDGSEILVSQGPGKNPRRLTPRECARLMGFPESQKIPVSDSQAYKQFGNSVAVPAIAAVARLMAPCVERLIQEEAAGVPWPKVRRRRAKPEGSSKKAKGAGQEG